MYHEIKSNQASHDSHQKISDKTLKSVNHFLDNSTTSSPAFMTAEGQNFACYPRNITTYFDAFIGKVCEARLAGIIDRPSDRAFDRKLFATP